MDYLKLNITILSNFMLGLLIIMSFINAIFLGTDKNQMWFLVISGINISCSIFSIVILLMFSIFVFRLLNRVEKLSKRKIINFLIFILCLILIILFSFFSYLLLIRGYESRYLLFTALLIFLTYSCRIIIIGSIFIINTVVINTCYTCYKCSNEMTDKNRRSDNLDFVRNHVWGQVCERYIINTFLVWKINLYY
jgi:uncharacterized BrkB/YihY/UPF0761 family membrane protein